MFGQDANQTQQLTYDQTLPAQQPVTSDPGLTPSVPMPDMLANTMPTAPTLPDPLTAAAASLNAQPQPVPAAPVLPVGSDVLLNIKQQALQQLSPLVSHLEQTPEEKFRTTMMMIQASDDQSLVQQAFDAANQITDAKAKAQALLDVINEINYFTQQPPQPVQ